MQMKTTKTTTEAMAQASGAPVVVAHAYRWHEAQMAAAMLRAAGIPADVLDALNHNAQPMAGLALGGMRLVVPPSRRDEALALLASTPLLASRHGRAWRAVRDDELAAAACGIDTDAAKMQAFVVGGALSGLAGGLYAHWIGFISPEQFGLVFSFELLMLAFIGGARRIAGAAWGALVIVAIPPLISLLRDRLPGDWARASGLELLLFGAVIVAVVLLRPAGLAGGGQGR